MSARVIRVDFPSASAPSDAREVLRLAEVAAAVLARHAGRTVDVDFVDGRVATARVRAGYRLSVSIGTYSTLRGRPLGADVREWQAARDAAPKETVVDVYAEVEWLKDPIIATEGGFGCEYAGWEFPVVPGDEWVQGLMTWVDTNCLRAPVERLSAEEIAAWQRRTVSVGKGSQREVMTLIEAVKIYGPLYGREICPEILVVNHSVSWTDARAIARAVLKILPRKRKP